MHRDTLSLHSSPAGLASLSAARRQAARRWAGLVIAMLLASATPAPAADPDLARARQLIAEARHQEAYELLQPFDATGRDDAPFLSLLAESALNTERAAQAKELFERALVAEPGMVEAHLGLGRSYRALGDYARARIEFETVLRLDDLPPGLQQQVEIYAAAARPYAENRRLLGNGYGMLGFGNYHTGSVGGGPDDDLFFNLRTGGNLNYELDDGYSLNGSLDYRYRNYGNTDRHRDSDLRWNAAGSRNFGEGNLAVGVRGRLSYRGDGIYRNDYGLYGSWRHRLTENDQISLGAEVRERRYPRGRLRDRTRIIAELTAGWTRSFFDGKASFEIVANGGYEFNTEREDGDAGFFGLTPTLSFNIVENLDGFVFGFWQHDRYNLERLGAYGDDLGGIGVRKDNLYEAGGGLTWQFAPHWSFNPELLYIHDDSNLASANYNSLEAWFTIRFDF